MKKKELYVEPEVEIIRFPAQDIVTASSAISTDDVIDDGDDNSIDLPIIKDSLDPNSIRKLFKW